MTGAFHAAFGQSSIIDGLICTKTQDRYYSKEWESETNQDLLVARH